MDTLITCRAKTCGAGKTSLLVLLSTAGVLALAAIWLLRSYNALVTLDEGVGSAWGQVESAYQRRVDLIPNLISTVRAFADHEQQIFEEVARIRTEAGKLRLSADELDDPELLARFQNVQQGLSGALTRLFAVAEGYPALRASENFLGLQTQLEGTENRINVARQRYNDAAKAYNAAIRRIPGVLVAAISGFDEAQYFAADAGAGRTVEVKFD